MNALDFLPAGSLSNDGLTLIASVVAFATVILIWQALLPPSPLDGRMKRLKQRRVALAAGRMQPRRHGLRLQPTRSMMRTFVQRLNLLRNQTAGKASDQLARAGWRSRDALVLFLFLKLSLPFAVGITVYVMVSLLRIIPLPSVASTLAPVLAVVIGAYLPDILVKNAIQKREAVIQKGLPDCLDLLVICAEAGLSLDAALTRVANEISRACPPLGDEVGLAAVELGFLPERRKALENLAKRVQLPAIRGIVTTLVQTERYGTPLANALRVLSAEFRNERMLKAEEKAARLPATLTVPMILFIIPALMVVLIGPGVLRTIDALKDL